MEPIVVGSIGAEVSAGQRAIASSLRAGAAVSLRFMGLKMPSAAPPAIYGTTMRITPPDREILRIPRRLGIPQGGAGDVRPFGTL
jgi:hypothetical protein